MTVCIFNYIIYRYWNLRENLMLNSDNNNNQTAVRPFEMLRSFSRNNTFCFQKSNKCDHLFNARLARLFSIKIVRNSFSRQSFFCAPSIQIKSWVKFLLLRWYNCYEVLENSVMTILRWSSERAIINRQQQQHIPNSIQCTWAVHYTFCMDFSSWLKIWHGIALALKR